MADTQSDIQLHASQDEHVRLRTGKHYTISFQRRASDTGSTGSQAAGGVPLTITVLEAAGAGAQQPGTPVPDAQVVVTPGDRQRREPRSTDAQGVVRFDALPEGQCQVRVSKPGFREEHLPAFKLDSQSGNQTAQLRRSEAKASLQVQLLDPDGKPVAGARARLQTPASATRIFDAAADAQGTVTFADVPAGSYGVEARHEERSAHGTGQVEVVAGQENRVEITLRPGVPLHLVTAGKDGAWAPVGHAYVELWEDLASPRHLGLFRSDAQGCIQSLAEQTSAKPQEMLPRLFAQLQSQRETSLPARLRDRLRARQDKQKTEQSPATPPLFPSEAGYRVQLHRRRPGQNSPTPPAEPGPLEVEKGTLAGSEQHGLLLPAGPMRLRVQLGYPRQRVTSLEVVAYRQASGEALCRVPCDPGSFRTGSSLGRTRRAQRDFCEVALPDLSAGDALRLEACYRLQDGSEARQELAETLVTARDLVF